MARKKHDSDTEDTAALAVEAARLEAKKSLDDSSAVESAALSDVALSDPDVTAVGGPPAGLVTDADIVEEIPAAPKPAWVSAARALHHGNTDNANGAWHDFFKEPLPTTPAVQRWTGTNATYSYYAGGRVLVAYRGGLFAVMATPALEKPVRPVRAVR